MIIKKHANKNEYCLSKSGHWVRDFTKIGSKAIDINDLINLEDAKLVLYNENKNAEKNYQDLSSDETIHEKLVIIGDGYKFEESQKVIESLPSDVFIIGVNGAFAKWTSPRRMNYYLVNNPFNECLYYYPQMIKTWPKCIASNRTNPVFLENFRNRIFTYTPTSNNFYSGLEKQGAYYIDDYRNSVCGALGLAYKFKAKKILLLSVLEIYEHERDGMEKISNNLWMYPQQRTLHHLIDANLYWLKKAKIDISYMDKSLDYDNASYIQAEGLKRYF